MQCSHMLPSFFTRRGPGQEYLKATLEGPIQELCNETDLDLEVNPMKVQYSTIEYLDVQSLHACKVCNVATPGFFVCHNGCKQCVRGRHSPPKHNALKMLSGGENASRFDLSVMMWFKDVDCVYVSLWFLYLIIHAVMKSGCYKMHKSKHMNLFKNRFMLLCMIWTMKI